MEITAKTKVKDLSKKEFKKLLKHAIIFCEENLGINRRKSDPLEVIWCTKKNGSIFGCYDPVDNSIELSADCETVSELTKTLIHEWTHHLQPILSKYEKLFKKYGYDNHPMEIEAYAAEKIWNRKMLNYLKKV